MFAPHNKSGLSAEPEPANVDLQKTYGIKKLPGTVKTKEEVITMSGVGMQALEC